jgi:hypothetical protein
MSPARHPADQLTSASAKAFRNLTVRSRVRMVPRVKEARADLTLGLLNPLTDERGERDIRHGRCAARRGTFGCCL